MKKSYTKLLIIALLCLIATEAFVLCSLAPSFEQQLEEQLNEVSSSDPASNPAAGAHMLITGTASIVADFAIAVIYAMALAIPSSILLLIVIFQLIARLVQIGEEMKGKSIASKVFTIISIVLQIILCLYLILLLASNLILNKILLSLSLIVNILSVIVFIKELRNMKKMKINHEAHVIKNLNN